MTVDQARVELKAFLDGDRFNHPDPEGFEKVLRQYIDAVIAENMEGYQRKPLRLR